jgi:hypothetical protein
MATKAQLEQRLKESKQALQAEQSDLKQTQRLLHSARLAVQVTKEDLDRKLEPVTLCEETGSERAERYERGLQLAKERLETLWSALDGGMEVSFIESLWRTTPTEDELISSYLESRPGASSEEVGGDCDTK